MKLISSGMSSKILEEAMIQQREVQEEAEEQNPIKQVFAEEPANAAGLDEEDIDEFRGFSETRSQFLIRCFFRGCVFALCLVCETLGEPKL